MMKSGAYKAKKLLINGEFLERTRNKSSFYSAHLKSKEIHESRTQFAGIAKRFLVKSKRAGCCGW